MPHPFDRYASFTDLPALLEFSERPLRKSKRVNLLKSSIKKFEQYAASRGWSLTQVPWCPEGFFIERDDHAFPLGKDLLHLLGHTYMQEAASMLPVALLDPQEGDTVLDLSAAPGSKTTHVASRIGTSGVIVANDASEKRLWALASNLQRCGVINAIIVRKVGQWYARHMTERFTKVLCDAPCTAQGTSRKDRDALSYCSDDNIAKMARLQIQLLESAIHAAKTGGRIVYSTCTLTPEENEEVVRHILNKFCDQLAVVDPASLFPELAPAVRDSQIVQEQRGFETMLPCARLWPQTYDTEGFFCAVFEKTAPTLLPMAVSERERRETLVPIRRLREISHAFEEWYGTPFARKGEMLLETTKQMLVTTEEAYRFPLPVKNTLMGLPFAKPTTHGFPRLSHETATLRGMEAAKQVLPVAPDDLASLLTGETLRVGESADTADGDVLLSHEVAGSSLILGRGLLKKGEVLNRLPREIVRMHT